MEHMGSEIQPPRALPPAVLRPPLPRYGHEPFVGVHRTRSEANGRLILPAALRGPFLATALIRPHRDRFLSMWTPQGFQAVVDAFAASQPSGLLDPRSRKRLHMSVMEVALDKQHRFVLSPDLRSRVRLESEVVLAGSIEAIEIWNAADFVSEQSAFDDLDLFFDGFEGI